MKKALIAAVAALVVAIIAAPAASAIDKVNTGELRKGVTVDGILEHERALQDIAIANDGNRAATTTGYDASVDYVANRLRRAGYRVTLDPFDFARLDELNGPSTFAADRRRQRGDLCRGHRLHRRAVLRRGRCDGPIFVAGNTVVPPTAGPRAAA